MSITSRTSLLGFLLALSALGAPSAQATSSPLPATLASGQSQPSIEARLRRITAALREQEGQRQPGDQESMLISAGFVNGRGGGWVNTPHYGGFSNHPYYGTGHFVNGGGGFVNARPGGGFVNARPGGVGFRNW
ncbi:MAG: GrrA/OscA1 family cyclophane-containing rSAM-modified RiPP [Cyanobacteriota bacterium]|jgi:rSAM-associated Gly-rich repeat protein